MRMGALGCPCGHLPGLCLVLSLLAGPQEIEPGLPGSAGALKTPVGQSGHLCKYLVREHPPQPVLRTDSGPRTGASSSWSRLSGPVTRAEFIACRFGGTVFTHNTSDSKCGFFFHQQPALQLSGAQLGV